MFPLPYRPFGAFRLLLAGLVVLQHFTANAAPAWWHDRFTGLSPGSAAVLVFFAMSGFVIGEAVDRIYHARPGAFLFNRFLRIAPHFAIAMLASVALHYVLLRAGTLSIERGEVPPSALVGAFAPGAVLTNVLGFLPIPLRRWAPYDFLNVAWAVRIEVAFYLAVGASLVAARWVAAPRRVLLASMAAGACLLALGASLGLLPGKVGLVAYFAFGWSLYGAIQGSKWATLFAFGCCAAMARSFVAHPTYTLPDGIEANYAADFGLAVGLLIAMVLLARATLAKGRSRNVDQALGAVTFPLYVYHMNVLVLVASVPRAYTMEGYAAGMALSFAVAWLMHQGVDPLVDRLRDRVRGERLTEAKAAARQSLAGHDIISRM